MCYLFTTQRYHRRLAARRGRKPKAIPIRSTRSSGGMDSPSKSASGRKGRRKKEETVADPEILRQRKFIHDALHDEQGMERNLLTELYEEAESRQYTQELTFPPERAPTTILGIPVRNKTSATTTT